MIRKGRKIHLTACGLLGALSSLAQDTTRLAEVEISALRTVFSSAGKRTDMMDSVSKKLFVFRDIGDLLRMNSGIYIRSYGPGAIAGSSFRGGNSSQTAVMWNGFNLKNPMLGQSDLSLLPSVLFDDISVEYGGSSSVWGSGAVGGSVLLGNSGKFNSGFETAVNLGFGSFSTLRASSRIDHGGKRLFSSTSTYLHNSNNDFTYRTKIDGKDTLLDQKHASFSIKGIMQRFMIKTGKDHALDLNIWLDRSDRQLPNAGREATVTPTQKDENIRNHITWRKTGSKSKHTLRGAFFSNAVIYDDPSRELHTYSRAMTGILESENTFLLSKHAEMLIGANTSVADAQSDAYLKRRGLSSLTFFAGNRMSFMNNDIILNANLRTEHYSAGNDPFTGNIALEYSPYSRLRIKINSAKVFRQPTLNEMYWFPGGNADLLPEEGYSQEGIAEYIIADTKYVIRLTGAAYYREMNNWILWVPGPQGSPVPMNLMRVLSRGTESKIRYERKKGDVLLYAEFLSAYTISTVKEDIMEFSSTKGRQLIYTPRYTFNLNGGLSFGALSVHYLHQYVGYRFTVSDNSQWLDPYHYSELRFSWASMIGERTHSTFFLSCNNLLNTDYRIMAGSPMPLRSFELGISLRTVRRKISNNEKPITEIQ